MKRSEIKRRPLADTTLASLEPEATAYRELDGDGLYFRVKPNGTKSWELRYKKPDGKWSWHGLGGYPDLSGAMAREKAREAKRLVSSGTDPVQHKIAQREAKEAASVNTFAAAAEYWFQRKAQDGRAASTLRLMRGYLDNDVLPALGDKLLTEITRRDCADLQERIEARGALNTRDKIRVALRQIFSQAIARGLCENNPASELGAIAAPTPKAKQYPHLLEPELSAFLQALRRSTSRTPARVATWLVLWTASRPGVVRYAEWTEIDFERALWSIPADKMKARRDHVTPLCRQALEALRELHRMTGRGRYLFPGIGAKKPVISENTINLTLNKVGYKGRLVGHGSRHTASTLLREHGWEKDFVEAQLAHKEQGVAGVYNQAAYLEQRRAMLQWYADYLDALEAGMIPAQRVDFDAMVNTIGTSVMTLKRA
ncbi:integrase arm-type DNA-binding domain-containing protein [Azotobacter chroococcum]|uniref:Integrase arm-type DNA-binding domain-containing protein n=1 Tax=Azotobacter chroococcum TaxID=353 RepID=A0AA43Z5I3_9GAMM|nr:integrase arm-type DNA-binding domain-containing protein [Azotobacter chroococcum]NHN76478.1 integrase arm-type DNA-binding domain-containing protein [Azotobacter chroococcum]